MSQTTELSTTINQIGTDVKAILQRIVQAEQDIIDAAESGGAQSFGELTDVVITNPVLGHIPRYDGSNFVNIDGLAVFDAAGSAAAAALASEPRDADLTAIRALTTTSYGRSFLTLEGAAALMNLLTPASQTVSGIVELATESEAVAGLSTTLALTPQGGAALIAQLVGAAPADLNEWAELVSRIQAGESDVAAIMTAVNGKQPSDPDLSAIAALVSSADKIAYATGEGTWSMTDFTSFARTILSQTNALGVRNELDVYSKEEIGDINTNFLAIYNAAKA